MGNYNNTVNLAIFNFMEDAIDRSAVEEILNIDSDYSENEEEYREDTITLGFENEAGRSSEEIFDKCKHIKDPEDRLKAIVEETIGFSNGCHQFIVGNDNWCRDHTYEINKHIIENGEWMFIVTMAYIS